MSVDLRSSDVRASLRAAPRAARNTEADDWTQPLTAWTRVALNAGERDIHAQAKQRFEKALLAAALEHTGGHRQQAAELLGLGCNTLTRKLGRKHDPSAS